MTPNLYYISTRSAKPQISFSEAMLQGLAADGGLFVPERLPPLSEDTLKTFHTLKDYSILGVELLHCLLSELSLNQLRKCIQESLNFPIPLVQLDEHLYVLEVFHGPTLAFKDVGARFMARILSEILQNQSLSMDILVATSGDTGSAVAHGFYGMPNLRVHILYPSGRITPLQEKQMTTLGKNIFPLKVEGNFDACQKLVKQALQDKALKALPGRCFSTANSINIARLLPQLIYHSWGVLQLRQNFRDEAPILSIPSGNLGNLMAAVYAESRGITIRHFIAATNINATFGRYLTTGDHAGEDSKPSFSSAMDVGHPSNLERLRHFYQNDVVKIRKKITALSITNEETLEAIRQTYQKYGYIADPHTAVGIQAARKFALQRPSMADTPVIVTGTAHPAKFPDVIRKALGEDAPLTVPDPLKKILELPVKSQQIPSDYKILKNWLEVPP